MNFDVIPRKVYPKTFLNTVFVVFSYSLERITEDVLISLNRFLKETFNHEEKITEAVFKNGFSFENKKMGISFYFSSKNIGVKYLKDDYYSFQITMMPLVYLLISFLKEAVPVMSISGMEIRKANVWDIKRKIEQAINEEDFINKYLSYNLVSNAVETKRGNSLRKVHLFKGESDTFTFEILYGLRDGKISDSEQYLGLVLDETVRSKSVSINLDDIDNELLSLNSKLYDVFHWSVSGTTIAYMNKDS